MKIGQVVNKIVLWFLSALLYGGALTIVNIKGETNNPEFNNEE